MQTKKIGFIGAGNMTQSIISGLVSSGYPEDCIMASNRSTAKLDKLENELGIQVSTNNNEVLNFADIVVLSVKPQIMADVLSALDSEKIKPETVFVSIAAGIPVQRLSAMLPEARKWIRAMPNTPSAVGLGMTGLYATPMVSKEDRALCTEAMQAIGEILWVDEEQQIDGVIAAAGSAPAYFFLFLEAMQNEAQAMGFDRHQSRLLVQQAMRGAAEMVIQHQDVELATLRQNVTSKGGTTAEAVNTLIEGQLPDLVSRAMQAAVNRAQQMSSQF